MNVTEILDQITGRTDNVGLSDSDYTNRRTRLLEYTVEEGVLIWLARDWVWRRTSTTLTIPVSQGFANLPTDFGSIGRRALLTNTVTGRQIPFAPEDELRRVKDQPGVTTSDPDAYSIYGQGTDFEYRLQVVTNTIQLTYTLPYNKSFPTLDETTNINASKQIPEQYHQTVWIPAIRSLASFAKGDQSWQEHQKQRDKGIALMMRQERLPQDTLGQFPSFFGGRTF